MPILSLRIIRKPRKERRCFECGRWIQGETIRLYGMAFYGDKPYNVYVHRACLTSKDALEKLAKVEKDNPHGNRNNP